MLILWVVIKTIRTFALLGGAAACLLECHLKLMWSAVPLGTSIALLVLRFLFLRIPSRHIFNILLAWAILADYLRELVALVVTDGWTCLSWAGRSVPQCLIWHFLDIFSRVSRHHHCSSLASCRWWLLLRWLLGRVRSVSEGLIRSRCFVIYR